MSLGRKTLRRSCARVIVDAARTEAEPLEQRMMLAFTALVNFQPSGAAVPSGYVADTGATFADRGNGFAYGWDASVSSETRDRNNSNSPDQRFDTLVHTQVGGSRMWEIAVPNDRYLVHVVSGDSNAFDSTFKFNAEGLSVVDAAPTTSSRWTEGTAVVDVSDGRLTISNAAGSANNKVNFIEIRSVDSITGPLVTASQPTSGDTAVLRNAFAGADVYLPNGALDPDTVNASTVTLVRTSDGASVAANVNTSAGGDSIVLQPTTPLAANTKYTFRVSSGVRDIDGRAMTSYTSVFTTGAEGADTTGGVTFAKVALSVPANDYTCVVIGPDGRLYAGTDDGQILRWTINSNGTPSNLQTINSIVNANSDDRIITGFAFDPASTASNLILWVNHGPNDFESAPDWSGKITRLTGSNLNNVAEAVVGLPRSVHDHMSNQPSFGPDGALYFPQGSMTAMGAPDSAWGNRSEHLLNAAILRVDTSRLTPGNPLNVRTEGRGSSNYNPWATNAIVKLYATGVRNAYDLVWTRDTNGTNRLWVPTNGSASGGATPSTPSLPIFGSTRIDGDDDGNPNNGMYSSPAVQGTSPVNETQHDYLFRIDEGGGGYYGHPNPTRAEFVMNGGNPTSGADPREVKAYPVGTQPDRNYRGAAFDFGEKFSPNGVIEYKSNTFNGALKGKLLVVQYSGGDNIVALTRNGSSITGAISGMAGTTGFGDPLDLVEDLNNGNLYVAEYGARTITLLRPGSAPTTPSGSYTSADVGSPGVTGSTTVVTDGVAYNVTGSGADIASGSDQFRFVSREVTGDFDYRVRVASLTSVDQYTMAGLMARASLAANSANVMLKVRPGAEGYRLTYRPTAGATTSYVGSGAVSYPNTWLRLKRVGNVFGSYRSTDGTNWTLVGQVTVSLPSTVLFGMAVSSHSNTATATAQFRELGVVGGGGATPVAPTNLSATAVSSSQVNLSWTDASSNETGFTIYRRTGSSGSFAQVGTVGAGVTSFASTGLANNTTYYFQVVATNATGASGPSNTASATTGGVLTPPAAPDNLNASRKSNGVLLTWDDNSTNESGFKLYRRNGFFSSYQLIATVGSNVESFLDTSADKDRSYSYYVVATNAAGDSSASNTDYVF
jgi:hypothetical protein